MVTTKTKDDMLLEDLLRLYGAVILIGGTFAECRMYASRHALRRSQYRCVSVAHDLCSVRPADVAVILLGTFWERSESIEIARYLMSRDFEYHEVQG